MLGHKATKRNRTPNGVAMTPTLLCMAMQGIICATLRNLRETTPQCRRHAPKVAPYGNAGIQSTPNHTPMA